MDSASGHSGRKSRTGEQAGRMRNRVSLHGNRPLAKLYAAWGKKVPEKCSAGLQTFVAPASRPAVVRASTPAHSISGVQSPSDGKHYKAVRPTQPNSKRRSPDRGPRRAICARWGGRPALQNSPNSVCRRLVFLAAGREQNRRHKHREDDRNDHKRGRNVHRAGLLAFCQGTMGRVTSALRSALELTDGGFEKSNAVFVILANLVVDAIDGVFQP